MRRLIFTLLASLCSFHLKADTSAHLGLSAIVAPAINTNISQTDLSSTKSLWVFSSQMNSKYLNESQKFEIEGLDQEGIEAHVKKVTANDRTIQYELLIERLRLTAPSERPVFLKISAN